MVWGWPAHAVRRSPYAERLIVVTLGQRPGVADDDAGSQCTHARHAQANR